MRKLIRKLFNQFGYDIVKLPPSIKEEEREDLKKLFGRIYHENMWGGNKGEYYSGPGSDDFVGVEYAKVVKDYIRSCVMLDQPPYNAQTQLLLEVDPKFNNHPDSRIRTMRVIL